ncbi:Helix-turn-helix domain-containing protein [Pustulibacterium marinum]|uniref:Helix-turn-helix domain-containing protein n=1 Tax=Pustulibacterium marinum TaxID=1224947 RepID=A0A1I7IT32_9FLAO|nr:helix-turn-helix domain-containing protein [Pustulibacterium marinum]SFU76070.1 Helix-turn-helix domain-containing protein [Pustulibacterium marinum]
MEFSSSLQQPVAALELNLDSTSVKSIKRDFYELLVCLEGNGILIKNDEELSFAASDSFFINKGDSVELKTFNNATFMCCRFSEDTKFILKDLVSKSKGKAVAPIRAKSVLNPKISCSEKDVKLLMQLHKTLLVLQSDFFLNANLMYYQLLCFLTIMERNIPLQPGQPTKGIPELSIQPIIKHIHKNLRTPELLSLSYIAKTFNLSTNSLGIFFKKEMNISVKQYILQSRMAAISKRIEQKKQSFSEIAFEFGFTDESHFYKSFKKHFGVSPSNFKKNLM